MINELKIRVLQTLLFSYFSVSPILEDRVAANVYKVSSRHESPRMFLSLPWQLTSISLTNSSSNFLALCCFLFISFFFWFMLLEYSAKWSNREGQEINTLPSLMKMSNGIIFERKSLYNWLTVVNLHILSTTVIHYISLVFWILLASGTGTIL